MPIPGVELLAGAAIGYLVRKARRVGGRADAEVDRVLDEGMAALHDLITEAVGDDPAVARLQEQAREGAETERGVQRAVLAVADTIEENQDFAAALKAAVDRLQQLKAVQARRDGSARARMSSRHREPFRPYYEVA